MNWGYKITLVIAIFIIAMLSMVFVAFKQSNEMIDDNYYEKELKYQSLIDGSNNLNAVYKDSLLTQDENNLIFTIPATLCTSFKKGKIEFIKNDDMSKDKTIALSPDATGKYILDKKQLSKGSYKARIQWINNETSYYKEQTISIK